MALKIKAAQNEKEKRRFVDTKNPQEASFEENRSSEIAIEKLKKARLSIPSAPSGNTCPQMPEDITELGDKDLGHYMGIYSAWISYAESVSALADIRATTRENIFDFVQAKVRIEKSGTVQDKSDQTTVDERYQEALSDFETASATRSLTQSLLRGYIRNYEALSRELTRRQNELKTGR